MRRRSIHTLCLLALAASAGCGHQDTDTEALGPKEICLVGSSMPVAAARSGDELSTDYKMWVAAIYHDQFNASHSYYFGSDKEKKFAWHQGNGVWKSAADGLYYPLGGTMDFLAYAIKDDNHKPTATYAPAQPTAGSSTFTTLTLDFGMQLDGSDPVVYSDIRSGGCGRDATVLDMQFRHAMAKIVFTARTTDEATSTHLKINNITVKGVKTSGILTVKAQPTVTINDEETGSEATWQLPLQGTSTDLSINTGGTYVNPALVSDLDAAGNTVGNPLYLPTQSADATDINVDVEYSIDNTGATFGPQTVGITLKDLKWEPGYQYNYMLTCTLTEITVECKSTGAIVDTNPKDINLDEQYEGDKRL